MENVLIVFGAFIISIMLGRIIIPNILIISMRKKLYDVPDARKVHKQPIPRLGGVTFAPVVLFTFFCATAVRLELNNGPYGLFTINTAAEFLFMGAGLTLLYIIGIGDDLIGVKYKKKFVVQIISASLIPMSGLYINNLYGLLGIYEIPPVVGFPLTVLLVVFITNAINLIDGIDGLASGLCMVALVIFGVIFMHFGRWNYSILSFICCGVIIPFFAYNVYGIAEKGRKIFMGDTGSLTLGYLLSFFVLKYSMYNPNLEMKSYGAPILISFSILLVPCLDVVRVVLKRAAKKRPLFLPDRSHIHHKFLDMGFKPRKAMLMIQIMSACFWIFTFVSVKYININLLFVLDILIWTGINLIIDKVIEKKKRCALTHKATSV